MPDNINQEKRKPGRPSGTKNKSPFTKIPLSELVKQLAPTALVPVKREFAELIASLNLEVEEEVYNPIPSPVIKEEKLEDISFTQRQPELDDDED